MAKCKDCERHFLPGFDHKCRITQQDFNSLKLRVKMLEAIVEGLLNRRHDAVGPDSLVDGLPLRLHGRE